MIESTRPNIAMELRGYKDLMYGWAFVQDCVLVSRLTSSRDHSLIKLGIHCAIANRMWLFPSKELCCYSHFECELEPVAANGLWHKVKTDEGFQEIHHGEHRRFRSVKPVLDHNCEFLHNYDLSCSICGRPIECPKDKWWPEYYLDKYILAGGT